MSISTLKSMVKKKILVLQMRMRIKQVLTELSSALCAADCKWFCDFGTLLGIVRSGKIISWDYEVDIGILDENQTKLAIIECQMQKIGAVKIGEKVYRDTVSNQKYIIHGVKIDIHYYQIVENGYCCYLTVENDDKLHYGDRPRVLARLMYNSIDLFKEVDVYGVPIRIPVNAEELLVQKYGISWRVPNPNWKTVMSPTITILPNETEFLRNINSFKNT